MRKFLLFLTVCIVAVLSACSNEEPANFGNEESTNLKGISLRDGFRKKTGGSVLDSLHTVMIESPNYIVLKSLRQDFDQKMHYNGDPTTLKVESDFLDWIKINISITDFIDHDDAVVKWNAMRDLNVLVIQENIDFYFALANEPIGSHIFYDILINDLPEVIEFSGCTCMTDYTATINALAISFADAVAAAAKDLKLGKLDPINAGADLNTITNAYKESLDAALSVYNACVEEC